MDWNLLEELIRPPHLPILPCIIKRKWELTFVWIVPLYKWGMFISFLSLLIIPKRGHHLDGIPRFREVKWLARVHRAWCGQNQGLMGVFMPFFFLLYPCKLWNYAHFCPVNFNSVSHFSQTNPPQNHTLTVFTSMKSYIIPGFRYFSFLFPNLTENTWLKPGCYLICNEPRRSFLYLPSSVTKELHTTKHFFFF